MNTKKILGVVAVLALVAVAMVGAGAADNAVSLKLSSDGTTWGNTITSSDAFVSAYNTMTSDTIYIQVNGNSDLTGTTITMSKPTVIMSNGTAYTLTLGTVALNNTLTMDTSCGSIPTSPVVTIAGTAANVTFGANGKLIINGGMAASEFHLSKMSGDKVIQVGSSDAGYSGVAALGILQGIIQDSYTGVLIAGSDAYDEGTNPTISFPAGTTIDTTPAIKVITVPKNGTMTYTSGSVLGDVDVAITGEGTAKISGSVANGGSLILDVDTEIPTGATLANAGTLTNNGTLTDKGTLTNTGTIKNNGTIVVNTTAELASVLGMVTTGSVKLGADSIEIASSSTVTIPTGVTLDASTHSLSITGHLTVKGKFTGKISSLSANTLEIIDGGVVIATFPSFSSIDVGVDLAATAVLVIANNDNASVDDILAKVKTAKAGAKVVKATDADVSSATGKEFTEDYTSGTSAVMMTKNVIYVPSTDSNSTVVGLTADVQYEVTIPASVALTTKGSAVTAEYKINVKLADPSSSENIVMKLTEAANTPLFSVVRVGGTQSLAYTFAVNGTSVSALGATIVSKDESSTGINTSVVTYTLSADPTVAGSYEDKLSFTVGFE